MIYVIIIPCMIKIYNFQFWSCLNLRDFPVTLKFNGIKLHLHIYNNEVHDFAVNIDNTGCDVAVENSI